MTLCGDNKTLVNFLSDRLEPDDKLDFLFHLDSCNECWDKVYNAVKAQHPQYYRQSPWRVKISDRALERLDSRPREFVEVA